MGSDWVLASQHGYQTLRKHDPQHFPRLAVVHHQLDRTAGPHVVVPHLLDNVLGIGCVMDNIKRIDQVVGLRRDVIGELFGIGLPEVYLFSKPKDAGALFG